MSAQRDCEDLPVHQTRLEELAKGLEDFHVLVETLNQHKKELTEKVKERQAELESKKEEIGKTEKRIQDLIETISNQEYSMEDVYQLERERAQLKESIAQTKTKSEEYESSIMNRQTELKRELERLERLVVPFNENIVELPMGENITTQIVVEKDLVHKNEQKILLGGADIKHEIISILNDLDEKYVDDTTSLKSKIYELMNEQVESEQEIGENEDCVEIISDKLRRVEENFMYEKQEHEDDIATLEKQIKAKEEKVETLRDPYAVETVMSKYHSQINDLSSLIKKHQEGNLARKQAVLAEYNHALRVCSEFKIYREKELSSLQKYLKNRQQFDIVLSNEDIEALSS